MPKGNSILTTGNNEILIIACGALAKEILFLSEHNNFNRFRLHCVPAKYHLFPEKIVDQIDKAVKEHRIDNQSVYIAFADCGTGGELDAYIEKEGFNRLPGAHCYEFFAGIERFEQLSNQELGTFYLTDFLARHFNSLIVKTFKLDQKKELIPMMFGHYKKLVYLAQTEDAALSSMAKDAANFLNLDYERIFTGYGLLENNLNKAHSNA